MRITHRMLGRSVTNNLRRNLGSLDRRSNQLSTGHLFDRPSGDPIGTYKSMKISGTGLARNQQYCRNIGEGLSWLTMTDDSLAEAIDVVHRLRELAVYSANAIHSPGERRDMVPEVRQLLEQLVGIGNTELAGLYIFGGCQTQKPPYEVAGAGGEFLNTWLNRNYSPAGGQKEMDIGVDNLATGTYAVSTAAGPESLADSPVTATVVAEYLHGARDSFFGTDQIALGLNSPRDTSGSVALEVLEATRYQYLSEAQKASLGPGGEDDRIICLGARYCLYDLDGGLSEGSCGFGDGEPVYLNLNRLSLGDQVISIPVGPLDELELIIAAPEALTFEENIPMAGDKVILQLAPLFSADGDYERLTLHKDYGAIGGDGHPTSGTHLDWYLHSGTLGPVLPQASKTTALKFFDLDNITGKLLTSTIEPEISRFAIADCGRTHRDVPDLLSDLIADEEWGACPAAIFTYIAPGDPYYVGDSFNRVVEISTQITVPTSITGVEAFGENELFQAVLNMEKALLHNDQFALGGKVLEELESQLDRLLKCRSEAGARMERLLITEEKFGSERIYLREMRSKVEDVDIAETITEFMMQENAYQAALATGARIIYPSLIDFLR